MAFTKDELLAKGIDPVVADEIIAGFSASGNDSPLLALQKAVEKKGASKGSKEAEDLLLKAEQDKEAEEKEKKGRELEKEGEEEEAYMKKKKEKEKEMKKAIDNIDLSNSAGGVVELADLGKFLESSSEFSSSMIKALVDLRAENKVIREELKETYSLMHKAAALQIETASSLEKVLGTPQGRKGATTLPVTEMEKAREAATIDAKKVWNTLAKAMKLPGTEGAKAGHVLSMFESAGQRIGALAIADREYISSLISKGE